MIREDKTIYYALRKRGKKKSILGKYWENYFSEDTKINLYDRTSHIYWLLSLTLITISLTV